MERRTFIMSSAGVLACAGMGAGTAAAANAAARHAVAGEISAAGFEALLHQKFTVHGEARRTSVELAEVSQVPGTPGLQQFSLRFSGSPSGALDSGLYDVEHPKLGRLMVYLDARKAGGGMLYRADFSLLG